MGYAVQVYSSVGVTKRVLRLIVYKVCVGVSLEICVSYL